MPMTRKQCTGILSSRLFTSMPSLSEQCLVCLLIPTPAKFLVLKNHAVISCCAGDSLNMASLNNLNIASQSENQLIEDLQDGSSVLHVACLTSDVGMVELLLQHGADINACDPRGRTPLHYCIIGGKTAAAKVLIMR